MRLWHYKLISVLPNKMLVSQWRECLAIKRQWEKGTLKHRLVNYVMNYNKDFFLSYVFDIMGEMNNRDINFQKKYWNEIRNFGGMLGCYHYEEHNDRYLKQCYYNLQEKYDRGIITKEEWNKILEKIEEE